MNSELINAIDEAIDYVNEDISAPQQTTLLGLINSVEGTDKYYSINAFKQNPWGKLDNKWDKLCKQITGTQRDNSTSYTLMKVSGVRKKDASGNPVRVPEDQCYIKFDSNAKTATLTTKENATPVDAGFFQKKSLARHIGNWLKNNPRNIEQGYDFSNGVIKAEKNSVNKIKSNQQLNYSILAEFYFNLYNNNKWNTVPQYWKVAVTNELNREQSIIECESLQFIDKAESIKFHGKALFSILEDTKISQLIYLTIIASGSIRINELNDKAFENSFVFTAILSGAFSELDDRQAADLLERFTRIKNYYGSVDSDLKTIIAGKNEDEKSEALAENAILTMDPIERNPLMIWSEKGSKYFEENDILINKIDKDAIVQKAYRAVTESELKRILTVVLDPSRQAASHWYLVINSKLYPLKQNKNKLTLNNVDKVNFYQNANVKVVFATKNGADAADSRINITDINKDTVKFKDAGLTTSIQSEEYFAVNDDNELVVKPGKGFMTNKFTATMQGAGRDEKVIKIEFGDIAKLNGEDPNPEPKKENDNEVTNKPKKDNTPTSNITEEQAKDAIKKYLFDHRSEVKIFSGNGAKNKIADFIDRRTFNGKSLSDRYKSIINSIIKEIQKDPELYKFNTELNQIKQLDGSSMLDVLIDILNGNMAEAIATKQANEVGQNIPGIKVDKDNIKAPEVSAQTIANKLDNISAILKQDTTNGTNKTSKDVINKVGKGDLAEIISWFNDRYSNSKKVNVDSTTNSNK